MNTYPPHIIIIVLHTAQSCICKLFQTVSNASHWKPSDLISNVRRSNSMQNIKMFRDRKASMFICIESLWLIPHLSVFSIYCFQEMFVNRETFPPLQVSKQEVVLTALNENMLQIKSANRLCTCKHSKRARLLVYRTELLQNWMNNMNCCYEIFVDHLQLGSKLSRTVYGKSRNLFTYSGLSRKEKNDSLIGCPEGRKWDSFVLFRSCV